MADEIGLTEQELIEMEARAWVAGQIGHGLAPGKPGPLDAATHRAHEADVTALIAEVRRLRALTVAQESPQSLSPGEAPARDARPAGAPDRDERVQD